ncbi:type II TA system antitoxin MqsA family protein [Adlercreutzia sp. ZJ141]|uniref:type II TA system antitoxin MqsA family protein n=1 Tax=Adlercreutzia sp. ZJ141 TaxID=2709406 RepID=UPI0013EA3B38|nr:type II TA system antitoxin MqsA family protein [Adlercreutzia sp. ZJ141]
MSELVNIYCHECDTEVHAHFHDQSATLSVRGEQIDYSETVAICPICGEIIGDTRIEGANLERAYGAYRTLHGILSPDDIKSLRNSYGLSLREFSRFLGFGEQTIYRYERGDIPDQSHNTTMLSAKTIQGARLLLSQNRQKLNDRSIARIEQRIQVMADGIAEQSRLHRTLEDREAYEPSATNGYRRLDLDRVAALVYELARKCRDLYWTKLQKALFFADMVCYERSSCSLTGLSYAHATFGPVMDQKDEVRYILVSRGTIGFRECGWGEILVPLQLSTQPFNAEEIVLIDEVASFVNSFSSASELSDFSHDLSCWNGSVDGEIIEYTLNDGEVGRAMFERMNKLRSL